MRLVTGLLFTLLSFSSLARADCEFFPGAISLNTAHEAEQWLLENARQRFTCRVHVNEYGNSVWRCTNGKGGAMTDCQLYSEEVRNHIRRNYQSIGPSGEGTYESWPSGQRYRCDRAFGCRPSRGGN